jgi:hypothetical protein
MRWLRVMFQPQGLRIVMKPWFRSSRISAILSRMLLMKMMVMTELREKYSNVWFSIGILDDNNLVLAPVRLDIVNMKFNKEVFCSLQWRPYDIWWGTSTFGEKKCQNICTAQFPYLTIVTDFFTWSDNMRIISKYSLLIPVQFF